MVKKDEKIETLSFWGPYFRVYTEFRIRSIEWKWMDILNFNIAEYSAGIKGAPRLSVKGNKLYIQRTVAETYRSFNYMIEENKWYKVEILQNFTSQEVSLIALTRPVDCILILRRIISLFGSTTELFIKWSTLKRGLTMRSGCLPGRVTSQWRLS